MMLLSNNRRKLGIRFLPVLLLMALLVSCEHKKEKTFVFKLGHVANEDHTWHKAFLHFDKILNERTDGKVRVQVYSAEQVGKEVEIIRSIRAGIADMTITAGTLQNWSEVAAFSDMPFLLRDTEHLLALADSEIGAYLQKTILEETGLRVVCYFQRGPRHLTSNRPIRHPDDLKGMIVRIPNVPSYVVAWQALGAKPTPMAFSEVFTSLQQGTVQAQENPLAMISSANFSEVQDYLNLTEHVISWGYVVIGEKQFREMPERYQEIFLEAAREMQEYEHRLFLEKEQLLKKELEEDGMEFIEVELDAFQEIGSEAVYNSLDENMKVLYRKIKAL
jgi:tripartite ATP-independent transporter DctP family solute receptor